MAGDGAAHGGREARQAARSDRRLRRPLRRGGAPAGSLAGDADGAAVRAGRLGTASAATLLRRAPGVRVLCGGISVALADADPRSISQIYRLGAGSGWWAANGQWLEVALDLPIAVGFIPHLAIPLRRVFPRRS